MVFLWLHNKEEVHKFFVLRSPVVSSAVMFTHTNTTRSKTTVYFPLLLLLFPENILRFLYSPLCITFMYIIRCRWRRWEYFHLSILRATNCATNDTINTKIMTIHPERPQELRLRVWPRAGKTLSLSLALLVPLSVTFLRPFHRVAEPHETGS